LRRGLTALRRIYPLLPAALGHLPRPSAAPAPAFAAHAPTQLFQGCVARGYEAPAQRALLELAAALDIAIASPGRQTCCGSLHAHAGALPEADLLAHRNREAFADARTVLTLASGCHEAVAGALHAHADTVDALAFLARQGDRLRFRARAERIALHLPCTQRNVVRSDSALRSLLARVPELDVIEIDAGFGCCGAAGSQMLVDPGRAEAFRRPLLEQLAASGATRLLSANLGCRLHFAGATRLPVQHPLEFLAECLDTPRP
jgi:glycolate oxidase iron-sulfur subunit